MKLLYFLLLLPILLYSNTNVYPTVELINSNIKIIDIRTKQEWKQTGVIKGSKLITFFDKQGRYDPNNFIQQLLNVLDNNKEKFAIICRSGNRTGMIYPWLKKIGFNVINLKGGINYINTIGIKLEK
jgi:rhodanese-related sulfurtransferase